MKKKQPLGDTHQIKNCLPEPPSLLHMWGTTWHFVLHVAVVCGMRTGLVQCTPWRQGNVTLSQARILVKPVLFLFWFQDTHQVKKCLRESPPLLHMWGTTCMPDSSNGMRTEPLAETVAHFVLHVAVVCARRTELVQYTPGRQGNLTLSQARILFKPVCFSFFVF